MYFEDIDNVEEYENINLRPLVNTIFDQLKFLDTFSSIFSFDLRIVCSKNLVVILQI